MTMPPPPGFDPHQGVPPMQYGMPPQGPAPLWTGGQAPRPKGLAIASMVLGIVAVALCAYWFLAIPAAIVALVLGIVALTRISHGTAGGKGFALTGVITGAVALVLSIIAVVVWFTPEFQDAFWEGYCQEAPADDSLCANR